jgi:cytochrome c oxidase subunit 3
MCTGFHGFHVIVGLIFLSVMFGRFYFKHFTRARHIGFETAA